MPSIKVIPYTMPPMMKSLFINGSFYSGGAYYNSIPLPMLSRMIKAYGTGRSIGVESL